MSLEETYDPAMAETDTDRFVVFTGCSGGGKSTLLAELGRRGFATWPEAGRQVVKEQDWIGGDALPWTQPLKFADLAVSRAMHQLILAAGVARRSFFDRGVVDQVAGFGPLGLEAPPPLIRAAERCRYHRTVFVAPPWPEIYRTDPQRRHGYDAALTAYEPLLRTYERFGYALVELPRTDVAARADFVLAMLG